MEVAVAVADELLMQRVSSGELKMNGYHYLEVMACPYRCLNSGGLIQNTVTATAESSAVRKTSEKEETQST